MEVHDLGTTTAWLELTWTGYGFTEKLPSKLWLRLPSELQSVAIAEAKGGNEPTSILENRDRDIVVLGFGAGPLIAQSSTDAIRVHTEHKTGNYCYDGIAATYEHISSGSFLAFEHSVTDTNLENSGDAT